MAKEQKLEKRYRVASFVPVRHTYFDCIVEKGEDFNMMQGWRDKLGMPFRTTQEIQVNLDNHVLEIYHAPIGTPHVVHNTGTRESIDPETGKGSIVTAWTDAAKQWEGETDFIDQYPLDTQEAKG